MEQASTGSTCSHPSCPKKATQKGMCAPHRAQYRKYGETRDVKPIERFDSLSDSFLFRVRFTDDCWVWAGPKDGFGHGSLQFKPYKSKAHRYSYETYVGPIPEAYEIDHQCRNPSCVRPSHLKAVTHAGNQQNRDLSTSNTSGYRGVCRFGLYQWRGYATLNGKQYSAGVYDTAEEANEAVIALRNRLYDNNVLDRRDDANSTAE